VSKSEGLHGALPGGAFTRLGDRAGRLIAFAKTPDFRAETCQLSMLAPFSHGFALAAQAWASQTAVIAKRTLSNRSDCVT